MQSIKIGQHTASSQIVNPLPFEEKNGTAFGELAKDKCQTPSAVSDFNGTFPKEDMSMSEYKLYIYDKLSRFPLHPSRKNWDIFVSISEEGFEAMKQDPAYEQWVLDTIQKDFAVIDPMRGNHCEFLHFGASKEDYKSETWSFPSKSELKRMREQHWERKQELKQKRKKQMEKKRLEERWKQEAFLSNYARLKHLDHQMQIQEENKALYFGTSYDREDHNSSLKAAARRKASAYESTFLFTGIGTPPGKI